MPQSGPIELIGSLGAVSKAVLFVLFLFSVISWAIIFYKWRVFRVCDQEDQRFLSTYARAQDRNELRGHARRFNASPSALLFATVQDRIAPVGEGGGSKKSKDAVQAAGGGEGAGVTRNYLDRVVAYIVQDQVTKLEAYLPFLATTGNITPFIGLLGTVLGIINAFVQIGAQGTASIAAVAPGVAEALVATAAGLFTAIPAVVAYNYFLTRIRRTTFRLEAFSIEFLNSLEHRPTHVGTRG